MYKFWAALLVLLVMNTTAFSQFTTAKIYGFGEEFLLNNSYFSQKENRIYRYFFGLDNKVGGEL